MVEARARHRMKKTGREPADYVERLDDEELDELLECVRVGETRLFRHRQQIEVVEQVIAPALRGRRELRVWSAGCAAGEEAYTLAAVLSRALPDARLDVLATDVSADALENAARAEYPATAIAHVPEAYREDFVVDGDLLRVRPELARVVRFERANLIDDAPAEACDLVWCRNVLIYFTPEARKRAIEHVVGATRMGGYVFVGYSESLRGVAELEPVRSGDAIYYQRTEKRQALRTPPLGMPAAVPMNVWREPTQPRIYAYDVHRVVGSPTAAALTAGLSQALAAQHLRLVVDLDGAELLADELAPVFRRAIAAANAANVELDLRATKPGVKRWLARHKLGEP